MKLDCPATCAQMLADPLVGEAVHDLGQYAALAQRLRREAGDASRDVRFPAITHRRGYRRRFTHAGDDDVRTERLLDEVERAVLHRFDGREDFAFPGEHEADIRHLAVVGGG